MTEKERTLKKILLPFDISSGSISALEAAFRLAAALRGEVSGLFIEDTTLLVAGGLPFAREIGSRSGISRRIDTTEIEQSLRATAGRARETLLQAGEKSHVAASFHVARGQVGPEILAASADVDLIVIGKAGWSERMSRRMGSTCMTLISSSQVPVMIVESGTTLAPPIVAINDGSPGAVRALEFARLLWERLGWHVLWVNAGTTLTSTKSRLLVVPGSLAVTACGEWGGAIVVVP